MKSSVELSSVPEKRTPEKLGPELGRRIETTEQPTRSLASKYKTRSVNLQDALAQHKKLESGGNLNRPLTSRELIESRETFTNLDETSVAALMHLMMWCENAEHVKIQMKKKDEELINKVGCCLGGALRCCCPSFTCCTTGRPPTFTTDNNNNKKKQRKSHLFLKMDDGKTKIPTILKHSKQLYNNCCCCSRVKHSLATSLFIWWDLPVIVVKYRIVALLQAVAQCCALVFNGLFLYQVSQAVANRKEELYVPQMVVFGSAFVFWLPDIIHAIYMTMTPGYSEANTTNKAMQVLYSLLAPILIRPLYDVAWSHKWMQVMPYASLQNEGDLVTDSGIHERQLIWAGLSVTLRELPLLIFKCYILMDMWAFWGFDKHGGFSFEKVTDEAIDGGALQHCTIINEWTVLRSIALTLVMSAFSLSDQLEREVPYGSFPKQFSTALRKDICSSPALLWTFTFLMAFLIDLGLKFIVLVPFLKFHHWSWSWLLVGAWFMQPALLCWWFLTENKTSKRTARNASLNNVEENSSELKRTRSYDSGKMLESLQLVDKSRCETFGAMVETSPFILWGVWVDLPLRIKWLRLSGGLNMETKKKCCCFLMPRSLAYYISSTLVTTISVLLFAWINYKTFESTWESGNNGNLVFLDKYNIPNNCLQNLQYRNRDVTTACPSHMNHPLSSINPLLYPSSAMNSTWILACNNTNGFIVQPQIKFSLFNNQENNSANLYINLELVRYMHKGADWTFTVIFPILVIGKLLICALITQQFYCTLPENSGNCCGCCCCCKKKTKKRAKHSKRNAVRTSTIEALLNTDLRRERSQKLHDERSWKSGLRSRDIQLMLRRSGAMPKFHFLTAVKAELVDVARVALSERGVLGIKAKTRNSILPVGRKLKRQSLRTVMKVEAQRRLSLNESTMNRAALQTLISSCLDVTNPMNESEDESEDESVSRKTEVMEKKEGVITWTSHKTNDGTTYYEDARSHRTTWTQRDGMGEELHL